MFYFNILGLCQDIEKFDQGEITFIVKSRILSWPLKYSPVLGVLSQRKLRNHKRPLIKKQRGKLPKPGRKMSLLRAAAHCWVEAGTADKCTKVAKLQKQAGCPLWKGSPISFADQ